MSDNRGFVDISKIRSTHLCRIVKTRGIVRQITDVLPKICFAGWECCKCGKLQLVDNPGNNIEKPEKCECGSTAFELNYRKSKFVDYQKMELCNRPLTKEEKDFLESEEYEDSGGSFPFLFSYIICYVSGDQTGKVVPGDMLEIEGILESSPSEINKAICGRYIDVIKLKKIKSLGKHK